MVKEIVGEFPWATILGAFGMLVTVVGTLFNFARWIESRLSRAREERIQQLAALDARLTRDIVDCFERSRIYADKHRQALDQINLDQIQEMRAFQMNIYKDFVREKTVLEVEARIMAAIAELKVAVSVVRSGASLSKGA